MAVAPIRVPAEYAARVVARKKFDLVIGAKLTEAMPNHIPASVFDDAWRENVEALGGIYHPYTGKFDRKRSDTAIEFTFRELAREHDAGVFIFPKLVPIVVSFANSVARFCGVAKNVTGSDETGFGSGDLFGKIPAICLEVEVFDANRKLLYRSSHGVGLLALVQGRKFYELTSGLPFGSNLEEAYTHAIEPFVKAATCHGSEE